MKILVIGAGIAGLSAAWHLREAGIAATVLEARDRIGGRVWTDRDFAGFPVEFGAELIHGRSTRGEYLGLGRKTRLDDLALEQERRFHDPHGRGRMVDDGRSSLSLG